MMDSDDLVAAEEAAERIGPDRARYFHDPEHRAGLALARCFGWRHHVAWDSYCVYRADVRWEGDTPPQPDEWCHQLQDREVWEEQAVEATGSSDWTEKLAEQSEADPERFATGEDLGVALREAIDRIAGPA